MLANAVKLRGRLRQGEDRYAQSFIEEVKVKDQPWRSAGGFDRLLGGFWTLMLIKCLLCTWAVGYWEMPISSFWVWLPSLVFGALCTLLYLSRE